MKTSKDEPEAECRRLLTPLADRLARTDPEERRRLVAGVLAQANPTIMRLVAELLVRRLEYKDERVCAGAQEALALLGPRVLPALESAVLKKPSEALLLRLAPLIARLGRGLSEFDRARIDCTLLLAIGRAPAGQSAVTLWAAVGCLRDWPGVPLELLSAALAAQTPEGAPES